MDSFHFASWQGAVILCGKPQPRVVSDVKPGDSTEWSLATLDYLRILFISHSHFM